MRAAQTPAFKLLGDADFEAFRPAKSRRLSWPAWLATYQDGNPQTAPISVLTVLDVE